MWRNFTKAVRDWQRSRAEHGSSYRPDLHYMRGPGPKWRAKYGNLAPKAPAGSAATPSLHDLAKHGA